ncbi:MAG: DMT family transporter [Anaerolineales bacterium]|nr:MAG: DMT family transporter [Anaerolineales bacterium]
MLGLSPIFGKLAILQGLDAIALVALRTLGAVTLLVVLLAGFRRSYFYIFPLGLAGCFLAGTLNGIGSIFFYAGITRIDASLGQLLYTLYPIWVAGLLYLDGQRLSNLTVLRLGLSLPGIYLITQTGTGMVDWQGVVYVCLASLLYALHIPINQRVLYEVPAPTVTLYTLVAMTAIAIPAWLFLPPHDFTLPQGSWWPILGLTLATFLARLMLFAGVKNIGGVQTSLFGLAEMLVTLVLAVGFLGERLSGQQWLGALLLILTLILAGFDREPPALRKRRGWLYWLRPPIPSTGGEDLESPLITTSSST